MARRSLVSIALLAGCAPVSPPAPITHAPEPVPLDAASITAPSASTVPIAPTVPITPALPSETNEIDEGEWLDSFHVRFDPDPACRWSAECWHAPKQKPASAAKAPFSACHAELRNAPLDSEATKKARTQLAKDACCYLSRMCKLPLPKP